MDFDKLPDTDKIKMMDLALKLHGCLFPVNLDRKMTKIEEITDYVKEEAKIISSLL